MSTQHSTYDLAVDVDKLSFDYGGPLILNHLSLALAPGSRCILVGANGAGKTTFLRILGGKRMVSGSRVNVLGKNVFQDAPKGVTYLGTEWANNPVVRSDLSVDYLLYSMGSKRWPERTQRLLQVLDVDIKWHMHQVSDGQRRRVQLVMGLLQPWDLLLLDEVTVDLDVLVRADFLAFLKQETETRGATIVYATHIFDGLGQWPTQVAHVAEGTITELHTMDERFEELEKAKEVNRKLQSLDSPLMELCYEWLRRDRERARLSDTTRPIDPETGLPHTKWDDLGADMKTYGDKYYNYWKSAVIGGQEAVNQLNHRPGQVMYTKPSLLPITQSIQDVKASLPPKLQAPFMTALRAFTLSWSLTTLPGVVSVLVKFCLALLQHKPNKISLVRRLLFNQLPKLLKKSIYQNGFPWLVTGAIASHRFVRYLLEQWSLSLRRYQLLGNQAKSSNDNNKNDMQSDISNGDNGNNRLTLFVSVVATMYLVRRLFPTSRTSELTSFTLFRAMDVYAHRAYLSPLVARLVPAWTMKYGSVIAFTLFCTEIMFSWFYVPSRLPRGYATWITKVAQMDERLILFLRAVRNGTFVYGKDTGVDDLLCNYCVDIGMPFESGLSTRGRVPCRLVHNGQPWGCEVNALTQFVKVVTKVFLLYFTVHLTPSLLFKRSKLVQNPLSSALHIIGASLRSSTFLATYTSSIWYAVCLTRTRIGHQLLGLDQTRLDTIGPFIGSAICGLSLIIESPHRRGEMALYVAPRALFSFMERLVNPWYYRGRWWEPKVAEAAEALVFAASTTTVLTAMYTDKDMVRSSVRGVLGWIMKYELEQEKTDK